MGRCTRRSKKEKYFLTYLLIDYVGYNTYIRHLLNVRDYLENVEVIEKIILTWILKKQVMRA